MDHITILPYLHTHMSYLNLQFLDLCELLCVSSECHMAYQWTRTRTHDLKGKGKGCCLESRLHDNACLTDFTFPLARWAPMQPATIDPTLDLCTRYPLRLGGPRQCGITSLPDTSTHGQHWESNPRPSDLESNALSTGPHHVHMFPSVCGR